MGRAWVIIGSISIAACGRSSSSGGTTNGPGTASLSDAGQDSQSDTGSGATSSSSGVPDSGGQPSGTTGQLDSASTDSTSSTSTGSPVTAFTTGGSSTTDGDTNGQDVTSSSSGASESTGTDTAGEPSYCECLDSLPKPKSCVYTPPPKEPQCQTDADCCDNLPEGYTCNDWPYMYTCEDGQCKAAATCEEDSQCEAAFLNLYQNSPYLEQSGFSCESTDPLGCSKEDKVCRYYVECEVDEDCCIGVPKGYECGDYPYNRSCENGRCGMGGFCSADEQCDSHYEEVIKPLGTTNFGCQPRPGACSENMGTCVYSTPCETIEDCCGEVPEGFTCGLDHPFLYECTNGYCSYQGCSQDDQCDLTFQAKYQPLGYINEGCK